MSHVLVTVLSVVSFQSPIQKHCLTERSITGQPKVTSSILKGDIRGNPALNKRFHGFVSQLVLSPGHKKNLET